MQRENRPLVGAWVLSAAALLAAGGLMAGVSAQEDEADPARQEYVKMSCYACHGYQGHGGGGAPRIAPDPIPYEAFSRVVRRPPNVMPAYSPNILSDQQLRLIYQYLESIPPPPEVSSLPLLSGE